eukprot:TRINITY_DN15757_c0_g1_i1.p1 TRINITY_DN15757_c0_g1~~TRINITY_DN15757_c0_g1_i1.p1  ORF type:complete len:394 (+),score=100.35 TRINITY_DN15757_c0_g1_i1:351-1532(+)
MPFLESDHPLNFMSSSSNPSSSGSVPLPSASSDYNATPSASHHHPDLSSSAHYDFATLNPYASHHQSHELYADPAASAAASVLDEMMGGRANSAFPSFTSGSYNAFSSYAHHLSMPGVPLTASHGDEYGVEGGDGVEYGQFTDPNAPISLHAFTPVISQKENKKLDDVYRNLIPPSFLTPSGQPKDGDVKADHGSAEEEELSFFPPSGGSLMTPMSKSPRKKNNAKTAAQKALNSTPRKKKISKVTDGDGNGAIEYIECKGPDTVLPSGRANGDRRYICQGQVIHRATFWRHRKRGCPHMHQRPDNDANVQDYSEYHQEVQHSVPSHVSVQESFSSSSDYQDDYSQAYHSEPTMFGESIPPFGGVFADPNMGLKGIIQSGMQPLYPIARSHGH